MKEQKHVEESVGDYSSILSIEEDGFEDVYCISVPATGNFVANGIVIRNCDALRYALSPFLTSGDFGHPDEQLSYDQLKRKIEGGYDMYNQFNNEIGGF